MIELLERTLKENWSTISPSSAVPQRIDFLYKSGFRKDIMIAFADHLSEPVGIGYLTNQEKIIKRMDNQYTSLARIHSAENSNLKDFVPRPLIWKNIQNYQVLFLSHVDGKVLIIKLKKKQLSNQELLSLFEIGEEWLIQLHNIESNSSKTLEEIVNERNLGNDLSELVKGNHSAQIPIILKHGDFQPTNLLYTKKKELNVIDWEYSGKGLPLYDLFYFLSHTVKQSQKTEFKVSSLSKTIHKPKIDFNIPTEEDFKVLFFEKSGISKLAKKTIESFCSKTNIDIGLVPILFYLFLHDFKDSTYMKEFIDLKKQFIL